MIGDALFVQGMLLAVGLCVAVGVVTSEGGAAEPAGFKAGVATVDITPSKPIWMAGYASRNKPSTGVDRKLFCKALALEDSTGRRVVIVAADLLGYVRSISDPIFTRAEKELGLARDQVVLFASHTHAGPVIREQLFDMYALEGDNLKTVLAYNDELEASTFAAIRQALADLKPAWLAFGRGRAGFAVNRRAFTPKGVYLGINPDGPVDHDVPVLRVTGADGRTRAVVFGYACHCTTLGGDFYEISGGYAGYAQGYLEQVYPGAMAMFIAGCGADANPQPRGKVEQARRHGLELAGAVTGVLSNNLKPLAGPLRTAIKYVDAPFAEPPSREEFERRLNDPNVHLQRHAKRQLVILDRDGKLPATYAYPVQVLQLGSELSLVALAGEVVVDYSLRFKRELGAGTTWVAAYANDVFAYIPTARVLYEGGYEPEYSMIYYGLPGPWDPRIEGLIVQTVHALVNEVRAGG